MLKIFLTLGIKKIDFSIALIFDIYVKFLDLLFLDKFTTILLALLLSSKILSSLIWNAFGTNFLDGLFVFNIEINNTAILLKSWIKC